MVVSHGNAELVSVLKSRNLPKLVSTHNNRLKLLRRYKVVLEVDTCVPKTDLDGNKDYEVAFCLYPLQDKQSQKVKFSFKIKKWWHFGDINKIRKVMAASNKRVKENE